MSDIRIIKVDGNDIVKYSISRQRSVIASGAAALLQCVITNLMTTPGTDMTSPYRGGGLVDMCRKHRIDQAELEELIGSRVIAVEHRMMQEQQKMPQLPKSETLTSLRLVSIERSETDPTEMLISIILKVADGTAITFTL